MDSIYRQAAIDAFKKELTVGESKGNYVTICTAIGYEGAKRILESLPSADVQPVRHGHWIRHLEQKNIFGGKCVECSECGEKYVVQYIEDEKYCRNCGARMDGEQNG